MREEQFPVQEITVTIGGRSDFRSGKVNHRRERLRRASLLVLQERCAPTSPLFPALLSFRLRNISFGFRLSIYYLCSSNKGGAVIIDRSALVLRLRSKIFLRLKNFQPAPPAKTRSLRGNF